ncbi:BREX-1 system adenine-specific DNA-methyltransferase PglX [Synechococcus sp. CBW1006]|uniref:BREX-1 system adenine-specific DNA-methyltransferase PglX n=1 Tax=Synechococcus sp. CBW1006 TaxID=1353138 RepID=UPI0018CD111C|nr:BREX-1 system adenine-specific DNA-methyltransferase PglX [Synechococcus sp. CBW1006]QPN68105.1 BREX-1 system adenine-specific DNA-methyltransferase PglX [Synechococcus sp. CBW1006]
MQTGIRTPSRVQQRRCSPRAVPTPECLQELFDQSLFKLLRQFEEAKTFGSLIQPCLDERAIAEVRHAVETKERGGQLFLHETHRKVLSVLEQAEALTQQYHIISANPPYLGSKKMNNRLKSLIQADYEPYKADLFSAFAMRGGSLVIAKGLAGFMTPNVWMYISSHENLRTKVINERTLLSLVELPLTGFDGATVQICAYVFENYARPESKGGFVRLVDFKGANNMGPKVREAVANPECGWYFRASSHDFREVPGSPVAYWVSSIVRATFKSARLLGDNAPVKQGLATSDNERFLRLWHEVSFSLLNQNAKSLEDTEGYDFKWYPLNKGGAFRRWYGNQEFVINWENNGEELWAFTATLNQGSNVRLKSRDFYFKESASWSDVTSGRTSARFYPQGFIFDTTGPSVFRSDELRVFFLLGLLNSKVTDVFVSLLNPTLHFTLKDANGFPLPSGICQHDVEACVNELIELAKVDWDNREISWNFRVQPLLREDVRSHTLEATWRNWELRSTAAIRRMQDLETENNRLFIAGYGLEGELQPEVPEDQITLASAEVTTDVTAFLSYATGCMMGRYSLDQASLILADFRDSQAAHLAAYEEKVGKPLGQVQFKPDADAIIPVLDGEWFEDDIVARTREFLEVTFPESTVTENLRFIEESLGKDIRKYFCSDFYKDHLQTYKKRPIYWMVQSPKKGFACLIYLHRYTKDTLNQVLNNYFRPYLQKLEARLAQLGLDQLNDSLPTRERTAARKEAEKITKVLKECEAWEQDALLPLAQQRIELDLDDGVKVNYLKLQDVLAPIPGLAAKEN